MLKSQQASKPNSVTRHSAPKEKLLFLVTRLERAGAEKQLAYISKGLKQRGWDVSIVSLMTPLAMVDELEAAGIKVSSLDMRKGIGILSATAALFKYLRQERPKIVCTFNFHADLLGRIMGSLAGVPIITSSLRNESFGGKSRDYLIRFTNFLTPVTTVNSQRAAKALINRKVVPANRLKVIPNGITLDTKLNETEVANLREHLALTSDSFIWFTAGRLEPQKDHQTLLKAFAELPENHHLLLAGEGALAKDLLEQSTSLGLGKRVHFLGLRNDIPKLLALADAFVLSSVFEGLPNVVMEALAAQRPVVSTDVGGVRELVTDDVSGFIVPASNAPELARAMKRLAALTFSSREHMGLAGYKHIQATYSLDAVISQWEQLFCDLLASKALS